MLRSDNESQCTLVKFNKLYEEAGIKHHLASPYSSQHYGVGERKYMTVMEMAQCLLYEKNIS
jgi:transposase InsO family protein